jgi:hypothetical protein
MRARRTLLASLSVLALAAFAAPASASVDSDGDGYIDDFDNCDHVAQTWQRDSDADQLGDACDPDPFTDMGAMAGSVAGGGEVTTFLHARTFFSFALRSDEDGSMHAAGRVRQGDTDVRILDMDHFHTEPAVWGLGTDAVATGWALVNGVRERYYLEFRDGGDLAEHRFDLKTGSFVVGSSVLRGSLRIRA